MYSVNTAYKIYKHSLGLLGLLNLVILCYLIPLATYRGLKKKRIFTIVMLLAGVVLFFFKQTLKIMGIIIGSLFFINTIYYASYIVLHHIKKRKKRKQPIKGNTDNPHLPTVALVIPTQNESLVISDTIDSIMQIDYPKDKLEIYIVDDHSSDNSLEILKMHHHRKSFKIAENLGLKGKANTLNYILKFIKTDLVMIIDADHHPEKDFLRKVIYHFKNPKVGCVQGRNIIRNGKRSFLSRLIEMEHYVRFELIYNAKSLPMFMGTGAVFKTEILKSLDQFNNKVLSEDLEISHRMYEKGYTIVYDNDISTFELATFDLANFFRQRYRWLRGILQIFSIYFTRILKTKNINKIQKIDFIQMLMENIALSTYFLTNILFFLEVIGIYKFNLKILAYITHIVVSVLFVYSLISVKKAKLLFYLPFIFVFYNLFAIPNLVAMMDQWIIRKKASWIKTNRLRL